MDPFVAEIKIFASNFAPKGWAECNGQIMPLSQNTALFSLLGTTYGGDGKSTFALPDLQGRVPMHPGQGPGLSLHDLGEIGGSETVTLLDSEIPSHSHLIMAVAEEADLKSPGTYSLAASTQGKVYATGTPNVQMAQNQMAFAGGNLSHNNMMPYLTVNFCIALQGVYPPRS